MEEGHSRRQQEEELARREADLAAHAEGENLQGNRKQREVDADNGLPHDDYNHACRSQHRQGHQGPGGVGQHRPRGRKQCDRGHRGAGDERRLDVHRPASLYVSTDGMVGALRANRESRLMTVKASEGMLPRGGLSTSPKVAVTE
jgi:hypothetical protein